MMSNEKVLDEHEIHQVIDKYLYSQETFLLKSPSKFQNSILKQ